MAGASFREIYQRGLWETVYYEKGYDNSFKSSGVYEVGSENIDRISIDWVSGEFITGFSSVRNSDDEYVAGDGKNSFSVDTAGGDFTIKICRA